MPITLGIDRYFSKGFRNVYLLVSRQVKVRIIIDLLGVYGN